MKGKTATTTQAKPYLSLYEYDLVNKIDTATKMFIFAKILL